MFHRFSLKTIFCALISILFFSSAFKANGQMRQVYLDMNGNNNEIQKISFYSPSSGYIASKGWIGFTADSGRTISKRYITWNNVDYGLYSVNLTFGFGIKGVKAFNQNNIIVYGDYGLVPAILYSNNGGQSYLLVFHSQFHPMELNGGITDMVFPQDNNTGYAVDADRILKTTNGGISWSVVRNDRGSFFDFIDAIDNNNVFAISKLADGGKILKTSIGGNSWTPLSIPSSRTIFYSNFITPSKGWVALMDYNDSLRLYYTSNGGSSWTQKNNSGSTPFYCSKMKFLNDSTGYAIGNGFDTHKTTDSGKVWQPLPRDNNFSYLYNSHTDLQCISETQLWAGGAKDFLELSTNGGGAPLPKAFFKIDTSGVSTTGTVNLYNFSKPSYSFRWYRNNVQISTSYNTSYTHLSNETHDSIKLVVSNGVLSDSLTIHQYFNLPVVVSAFTPTTGATGTQVTITGQNFTGATSVRFGGTPAGSFTIVSSTQINAVVNAGATGSVTVATPLGTGSKSGFTYLPPPAINLPTTISDAILCKSEPTTVFIQNTQAEVRYDLIDSLNFSYGFINSNTNGGTVALITNPIFRTGNYRIKATRLNINSTATFTNKIFIQVEHTKSGYTATKVNITPGETLNFYNQSKEAQTFNWSFDQDASTGSSSLAHPQNISYTSPGQKTLRLISISPNGCRDTITGDAAFIYTKSFPDATCYIQNINDSDYAYFPASPASINPVAEADNSNGYLISGFGNKPKLKSRAGVTKELTTDGTAYVAKYNADGILNWFIQIKNSGKFYATQKDANGNIYVLGSCKVQKYLTLVNGDSIRVSATPEDTLPSSGKINGFILKLDANGNYVWHTVLDDHSRDFSGYPIMGGLPERIKIVGDQICISGRFLAHLSYFRNGVKQTMITLPNSTYPNDLQNDFIMRIREDGSLVWHAYFENDATNQIRGITGIEVDRNKHLVVAGTFEAKISINDANNTKTITYVGTTGSYSSYLLQFDSLGRLKWNAKIENPYSFRRSAIKALALDGQDNIYVTGMSTLNNESQYFRVTNSDNTTTDLKFASFFLLRFTPSGVYRWGTGSKTSYYGEGSSVYIKENNIYIAGTLANNGVMSGEFTITSTDGNHQAHTFYSSEFFIFKYDTAGVLKRVVKSGDNGGGEITPVNLIIDNSQNCIISGMANNWNGGNSSFTAFASTIGTNGHDAFFTKLNPDFCYPTTAPVANAGIDISKCPGESVTIGTAALPKHGYFWTSQPAGFSSTLAMPVVVTPTVTTSYFLTVANEYGVTARDTVVITAQPAPAANAGDDQSICIGSSTTIGSSAVPGYIYSWTSQPTGFVSALANPTITPTATTKYFLSVSNGGCAGRDTVNITVNNISVPSVSISSSNTTICQGTSVGFIATPVNGGTAPSYQWMVNGSITGTAASTFNTTSLINGAEVKVVMTSNVACATPATTTSNIIKIAVNSTAIPTITIAGATNVNFGESTVLKASITRGGSLPLYQWQDSTSLHLWQNINGATRDTIKYIPAQTGDRIRCVLTSNENCVSPTTIESQSLAFVVNTTSIGTTPTNNNDIICYPNPATTTLFIDSLRLSDNWQTLEVRGIDGRIVMPVITITNRTSLAVPVEQLLSGMYILVFRRQKGEYAYLRFVKQ